MPTPIFELSDNEDPSGNNVGLSPGNSCFDSEDKIASNFSKKIVNGNGDVAADEDGDGNKGSVVCDVNGESENCYGCVTDGEFDEQKEKNKASNAKTCAAFGTSLRNSAAEQSNEKTYVYGEQNQRPVPSENAAENERNKASQWCLDKLLQFSSSLGDELVVESNCETCAAFGTARRNSAAEPSAREGALTKEHFKSSNEGISSNNNENSSEDQTQQSSLKRWNSLKLKLVLFSDVHTSSRASEVNIQEWMADDPSSEISVHEDEKFWFSESITTPLELSEFINRQQCFSLSHLCNRIVCTHTSEPTANPAGHVKFVCSCRRMHSRKSDAASSLEIDVSCPFYFEAYYDDDRKQFFLRKNSPHIWSHADVLIKEKMGESSTKKRQPQPVQTDSVVGTIRHQKRRRAQSVPTKVQSNTGKFIGVTYRSQRGKFQARVYKGNKEFNIGLFDVSADAALAYDVAQRLMRETFSDQTDNKLRVLDEWESNDKAIGWIDMPDEAVSIEENDGEFKCNFCLPSEYHTARETEIKKRNMKPESSDAPTKVPCLTYPTVMDVKIKIRAQVACVAKLMIDLPESSEARKRRKTSNSVTPPFGGGRHAKSPTEIVKMTVSNGKDINAGQKDVFLATDRREVSIAKERNSGKIGSSSLQPENEGTSNRRSVPFAVCGQCATAGIAIADESSDEADRYAGSACDAAKETDDCFGVEAASPLLGTGNVSKDFCERNSSDAATSSCSVNIVEMDEFSTKFNRLSLLEDNERQLSLFGNFCHRSAYGKRGGLFSSGDSVNCPEDATDGGSRGAGAKKLTCFSTLDSQRQGEPSHVDWQSKNTSTNLSRPLIGTEDIKLTRPSLETNKAQTIGTNRDETILDNQKESLSQSKDSDYKSFEIMNENVNNFSLNHPTDDLEWLLEAITDRFQTRLLVVEESFGAIAQNNGHLLLSYLRQLIEEMKSLYGVGNAIITEEMILGRFCKRLDPTDHQRIMVTQDLKLLQVLEQHENQNMRHSRCRAADLDSARSGLRRSARNGVENSLTLLEEDLNQKNLSSYGRMAQRPSYSIDRPRSLSQSIDSDYKSFEITNENVNNCSPNHPIGDIKGLIETIADRYQARLLAVQQSFGVIAQNNGHLLSSYLRQLIEEKWMILGRFCKRLDPTDHRRIRMEQDLELLNDLEQHENENVRHSRCHATDFVSACYGLRQSTRNDVVNSLTSRDEELNQKNHSSYGSIAQCPSYSIDGPLREMILRLLSNGQYVSSEVGVNCANLIINSFRLENSVVRFVTTLKPHNSCNYSLDYRLQNGHHGLLNYGWWEEFLVRNWGYLISGINRLEQQLTTETDSAESSGRGVAVPTQNGTEGISTAAVNGCATEIEDADTVGLCNAFKAPLELKQELVEEIAREYQSEVRRMSAMGEELPQGYLKHLISEMKADRGIEGGVITENMFLDQCKTFMAASNEMKSGNRLKLDVIGQVHDERDVHAAAITDQDMPQDATGIPANDCHSAAKKQLSPCNLLLTHSFQSGSQGILHSPCRRNLPVFDDVECSASLSRSCEAGHHQKLNANKYNDLSESADRVAMAQSVLVAGSKATKAEEGSACSKRLPLYLRLKRPKLPEGKSEALFPADDEIGPGWQIRIVAVSNNQATRKDRKKLKVNRLFVSPDGKMFHRSSEVEAYIISSTLDSVFGSKENDGCRGTIPKEYLSPCALGRNFADSAKTSTVQELADFGGPNIAIGITSKGGEPAGIKISSNDSKSSDDMSKGSSAACIGAANCGGDADDNTKTSDIASSGIVSRSKVSAKENRTGNLDTVETSALVPANNLPNAATALLIKYTGVTFRAARNKYQARIHRHNKEYTVGFYDVSADAALAYDVAQRLMKKVWNGHGKELEVLDAWNTTANILEWVDLTDPPISSDKNSTKFNFNSSSLYCSAREVELKNRTAALSSASKDPSKMPADSYPTLSEVQIIIKKELFHAVKLMLGQPTGQKRANENRVSVRNATCRSNTQFQCNGRILNSPKKPKTSSTTDGNDRGTCQPSFLPMQPEKYMGVVYLTDRQKFQASTLKANRQYIIGLFCLPSDAALAWDLMQGLMADVLKERGKELQALATWKTNKEAMALIDSTVDISFEKNGPRTLNFSCASDYRDARKKDLQERHAATLSMHLDSSVRSTKTIPTPSEAILSIRDQVIRVAEAVIDDIEEEAAIADEETKTKIMDYAPALAAGTSGNVLDNDSSSEINMSSQLMPSIPMIKESKCPSTKEGAPLNKYVGVDCRGRGMKYRARIRKGKYQHNIGFFDVPTDAALAYDVMLRLTTQIFKNQGKELHVLAAWNADTDVLEWMESPDELVIFADKGIGKLKFNFCHSSMYHSARNNDIKERNIADSPDLSQVKQVIIQGVARVARVMICHLNEGRLSRSAKKSTKELNRGLVHLPKMNQIRKNPPSFATSIPVEVGENQIDHPLDLDILNSTSFHSFDALHSDYECAMDPDFVLSLGSLRRSPVNL